MTISKKKKLTSHTQFKLIMAPNKQTNRIIMSSSCCKNIYKKNKQKSYVFLKDTDCQIENLVVVVQFFFCTPKKNRKTKPISIFIHFSNTFFSTHTIDIHSS